MPYKDPVQRNQHQREYYLLRRQDPLWMEKQRERCRLYHQRNKDRVEYKEKRREYERTSPKRRVRERRYAGTLPAKEYRHKYYQEHKAQYREYRRKWRQMHQEQYRRNAREYTQKRIAMVKKEVFAHYSGGNPRCVCCGESNIKFLSLDHIDNNGAQDRETKHYHSGNNFYSWLRTHNYPSDIRLQVKCYNCNMARAFYKICPHEVD